jgi:hypothetical protein
MASHRKPGPAGINPEVADLNDGTLVRQVTPPPGPTGLHAKRKHSDLQSLDLRPSTPGSARLPSKHAHSPSKGHKDKPPPPVVEYELIELVECVQQDALKWVKGACMATADKAMFPSGYVERKDLSSGQYKQYINLDHDLEGSVKRHPQFGREIVLRARVKQKNGNTDQLAGVGVRFTFKRTDGPLRKNHAPNAAVWMGADLTGAQKEGFGSANGKAEITARTDGKGWTSAVSFFCSQYAGDQFVFHAELAPGTPGAKGSGTLNSSPYLVARRFWYQMTYAKGSNPPQPGKAATAYGQVDAEMLKSNTKVFEKKDLPAGLQPRTFMPRYMLAANGGNSEVAVIGAHNKDKFPPMQTTEADKPLKAHLIVCEFQCDPADASPVADFPLSKNGQSVTIPNASGSIVCKPALAGGNLVVQGEWATVATPWTKRGTLTDDNITIDSARADTLDVKITLPADAPTPTAAANVFVRLKVQTAADFLGESFGKAQILCVYSPTATAGDQGSEVDFNDTVAHELGHMWSQTPRPGVQPASMKDHPLQYDAHGGQGPHCRHGSTVAAGPVHWHNANENKPVPKKGDCIMFHTFSKACKHEFCVTCKSYLRLQDMAKLK